MTHCADARESAGFIINAPSNGGRIKSCAALPEIASEYPDVQLLARSHSPSNPLTWLFFIASHHLEISSKNVWHEVTCTPRHVTKEFKLTCAAPGAFKQQLLYQGGCLAVERLHLLHGNSAVVDTYEVIEVGCPTHLATWPFLVHS